jgi:hypothetical protein
VKQANPRVAILAATLCGLAACTTGQSSTVPATNLTPTHSVLQLAVGTANFSGVAAGLNVVETFRGPNGYTAIPVSSAILTGPAGLTGFPGSKDPGAGSATIPLGSAQNQFVIGTGGTILASADAFGVGPPASSNTGLNFYPYQPQFGDALNAFVSHIPQLPPGAQFAVSPVYGGPPAYPPVSYVSSALSSLVQVPSGWSEGFYLVATGNIAVGQPPPSGAYTLTVSYSQNGSNSSATAKANLGLGGLPAMNPPQIASTGTGGAAISVQLPPGAKQAFVNVIDLNVPPGQLSSAPTCANGLKFATVKFASSGTRSIPANLGQGGGPTFCKGDTLEAQAFAFDYDDYDLGPPGNSAQAPALPAQADVSISFPNVGQE